MQERTLEGRVGSLELRAEDTEGRVSTLEWELKEFRGEVREAFTRVHHEAAEFRAEVRGEFMTAHARVDGMDARMDSLEKTMKEGFDQARQLTLVLHEQLRSDIRTMGEGSPRRKEPPATE